MAAENPNTRLEAFCDGVFAIALTLLIIDVRLPASVSISSSGDLWAALGHLGPTIFAFLLSFAIILITWVNHHETLKLVNRSSSPFMYANGFLLLTVVFIPFPTALLGAYVLTDYSSPAVILYSAVCAFQAVGWNLLGRAALSHVPLTKSEQATAVLREKFRYSHFAFVLYTLCGVAAIWFPHTIAVLLCFIWLFWLIISVRMNGDGAV